MRKSIDTTILLHICSEIEWNLLFLKNNAYWKGTWSYFCDYLVKEHVESHFSKWLFSPKPAFFFLNFFLCGFSFTNIHQSQDCRGRGRAFFQFLATTSTRFTDSYTPFSKLLNYFLKYVTKRRAEKSEIIIISTCNRKLHQDQEKMTKTNKKSN